MDCAGYIKIGMDDGIVKVNSDCDATLPNSHMISIENPDTISSISDSIEYDGSEQLIVECDSSTVMLASAIAKELIQRTLNMVIVIYIPSYGLNGYSIIDDEKVYYTSELYSCIDVLALSHEYKPSDIFCRKKESRRKGETELSLLQNGMSAYITGRYSYDIDSVLAKHVELSENCDWERVPFNSLMDINHAVLVDSVKYDSHLYEQIKYNSQYTYVCHVHQRVGSEIYLDDSAYKMPVYRVGYSEYKDRDFCRLVDTVFFLDIASQQDFDAWQDTISAYENAGTISDVNSCLTDECRWINSCSLQYLCRYRITSEMKIQPCLTSSKTVCNVDEPQYMRQIYTDKLIDNVKLSAGCATCNCKSFCSKCALLPESVTQNQYCKFIQAHPMVFDYINKRDALRFLINQSSFIKSNWSSIHVSNILSPLCLEQNQELSPKLITDKILMPHYDILFSIGKDIYLHIIESGDIVKIDERLAYIMEAVRLGFSSKIIADHFQKKFNCALNDAERLVEMGLDLLKTKNISI